MVFMGIATGLVQLVNLFSYYFGVGSAYGWVYGLVGETLPDFIGRF